MDIKTVKKQIQAKSLGNFYIFTGEEIEAQRLYVEKMAEVSERKVVRVDSVADVLKFKAGIIKIPRLFVVRDDKDFMDANKGGKAWDTISDLLGDKILILQITAADKRTKFFKHFEEQIVTFNYMSEDVLLKYVLREVGLTYENALELIRVCKCDYSRLLLETDKIRQFAGAEDISDNESFERLISDGTIYKSPEDAIFDFVDAVLQAKPNRAYRLLEDCKAIGEASLTLISVLYTNTKRVLQVQTCESKDVSGVTGLSAWDIKCARKNLNYWDSRDLVDFLKVLQKAEKSIKMGELEDSIAIDFVLSHIF